MSTYAYTAVIEDQGYKVGLAHQGVKGYEALPNGQNFPSYADAQQWAEYLNNNNQVTKQEAFKIVASSM